MNEWLKKLFSQITELWSKWSMAQRVIVGGIVAAGILALVLIPTLSSRPTATALFSVPVTDEILRDQIAFRLAEENVSVTVSVDGMIYVDTESIARRMRTVLVTEGLVPGNIDPWALFDVERWTTSDFTNNVNLQRAVTAQLVNHIEALDDIDRADVMLSMPEDTLFSADQKPFTASVILTTKPGSDFASDKVKVEGVQKLLMMSISGLTAENITITDNAGVVLNNFEGLREIERVNIIEKEQLLITSFETMQRAKVLEALQKIYSEDRVRDLNVNIDMDMSQMEISTTEHFPFTLIADNPDTPYDDSELLESVTVGSQEITKVWRGTGYNPEGPAGVEGQNPPVYSDMSNLYGINEETSVTRNQVINTRNIQEIRSPEKGRITVSVNIDGQWNRLYDETTGKLLVSADGRIQREYTPLTAEEILSVQQLIQGAIGYDSARGDSVVVQNIQVNRQSQFEAEDALYMQRQQTQRTILIAISSVIAILMVFIIFRFITRELERRRRLREEELLRKHQLEREKTLWEAQQAGMEVTMSVEERERAELQENAITIVREHPEDVAMLIRSWLMEE
ncbi:MAG: flagellar basal-body MS-ring/collar protein FliF [Spirochaetales bacterium]